MVNLVPSKMPLKSYCSAFWPLCSASLLQWPGWCRMAIDGFWYPSGGICAMKVPTPQHVIWSHPTVQPILSCALFCMSMDSSQTTAVFTDHQPRPFHSRPLPLESPSVHSQSPLQEYYVFSGQSVGLAPQPAHSLAYDTSSTNIFWVKQNWQKEKRSEWRRGWQYHQLMPKCAAFLPGDTSPFHTQVHVALNVSPYHFLFLFRATLSCFLLNQKLRRSQVHKSPTPVYPRAPLETVLLEKKR